MGHEKLGVAEHEVPHHGLVRREEGTGALAGLACGEGRGEGQRGGRGKERTGQREGEGGGRAALSS